MATLLLRVGTAYDQYSRTAHVVWCLVQDGITCGTYRTYDDARRFLVQAGYTHTDNTAGESHAEVWTREVK